MDKLARGQLDVNMQLWEAGEYVADYANRVLLPVEVVILARYREALSGRVLELGCGAGRILGYLVALGGEVQGIDVSPAMVDYCRRRYPEAEVRVGDIGALGGTVDGQFDAVLAADNVLDVFDDAERRRVLGDIRELISPGGIFAFSSHNLSDMERVQGAPDPGRKRRRAAELLSKLVDRPPADVLKALPRIPRRIRNRRRLAPLQRRAENHAILNDIAHDYGLLHYYIRREDQARQLAEIGYELVECLDAEGRPVDAGEPGESPWLHYIARPAPPPTSA